MNLQIFEKWEKNLFEIVDISNSLTAKIKDKYCFKKIFKLDKIGNYKSSIFLKNACVDLTNTFIIQKTSTNPIIKMIKGKYLLITEFLFNSGIMTDNTRQIGPNNIFSGEENDVKTKLNQFKDRVIKAEPPIVRIMLNINGEIILGDISKGQEPIYDSEEVLLFSAKNTAKVLKSHDYVYYKTANGIYKQILNQVSNVYTLFFEGHLRYFIDYAHIKNYLINRLMNKAIWIA